MRVRSSRAKRKDKSHKQGFDSRWTDFASDELHTNVYSIGERDLAGVYFSFFKNGYELGNHLAKVVHGELCKDFLANKVDLF